ERLLPDQSAEIALSDQYVCSHSVVALANGYSPADEVVYRAVRSEHDGRRQHAGVTCAIDSQHDGLARDERHTLLTHLQPRIEPLDVQDQVADEGLGSDVNLCKRPVRCGLQV